MQKMSKLVRDQEARNNFASAAPDRNAVNVEWPQALKADFQSRYPKEADKLCEWIQQLIQLDPRPAYKADESFGEYAMTVFDLNIRWTITAKKSAVISSITPLKE